MLLIKTHVENGAWRIFEAESEVEYLGSHVKVAVDTSQDVNFWTDDRFPTDDCGVIHVFSLMDPSLEPVVSEGAPLAWESLQSSDDGDGESGSESGPEKAFVHWIKWRDADGVGHLMVTTNDIYLCNASGDTIEAIR